MTTRRTSQPGICRVNIEGLTDRRERRIGNRERFVVAMRKDRSATITVDANSPEMAEAIALDFWKLCRPAGRPSQPFVIKRDPLPEPTEEAWELFALQSEIERAEQIASQATAQRNELIREIKDMRPTDIADVTGLTKGRISQILHRNRDQVDAKG